MQTRGEPVFVESVPEPGTCKGDSTLILDFGHFALRKDTLIDAVFRKII
jgi:hypothetical protein